MNEPPPRCPYCGSIEIYGNTCFWCNNHVTNDALDERFTNNSERTIKMTLNLSFSDLTLDEASRLIDLASDMELAGKTIAKLQPVRPAPTDGAIAMPAAAPTSFPPQAFPAAAPAVTNYPAASAVTAPPAQPVPTAPAPTVPPTAPVPTSVKKYTADELALAARPIAEAGRQQELINLIRTFQVTDASGMTRPAASIRDLLPEQYPAFANGLRQLGGRI